MRYVMDLKQMSGRMVSINLREVVAVRDAGDHREVYIRTTKQPICVTNEREGIVSEWKRVLAYGDTK